MKVLLPAMAAMLLAFNTHASDHPAPVRAAIVKGVKIEATFDTPAGLKAYAGRINGDLIALYLTPDGVPKSATILAARDPKAVLLEHDRNFDKGGTAPLKVRVQWRLAECRSDILARMAARLQRGAASWWCGCELLKTTRPSTSRRALMAAPACMRRERPLPRNRLC